MPHVTHTSIPNQAREQTIAQAVAPEPDIMFIDIDDTYEFKCYVGNEIIALISFDISNDIQPWSISIAGKEVHRTSIHPDAMEWVRMYYSSKLYAITLRTQRAVTIEILEVHNDEYVVRNPKNDHHYIVRPLHPNPRERCECGDCHFRGIKCKHQIAVESFINARLEKASSTKVLAA